MLNTGRFKYNPETKEMEKVSNCVPGIPGRVWFPDACSHSGHYSENLNKRFYSRKEKREYLRNKKIVEAG